jgi:hypothetical protein
MLNVPSLNPIAIISDDAHLAAQLSCLIGRRKFYTAVLDGPRLTRPDRTAEVARRHNAIARLLADHVLLAGLPHDSALMMEASLPRRRCRRIAKVQDAADLASAAEADNRPALTWGRNRVGVGTLKALREGKRIEFTDDESPDEMVPPRSEHLVVCETGEELSEVIAANYAFSLGAGLCLIPAVPDDDAKSLLEKFYGLYDDRERSPSDLLEGLIRRLRELCPGVTVPLGGSITFITKQLPFGVGFPESPTTHLYSYPDLGIAIVNGLTSEQPGKQGVGVAVLVDPDTTPASEIEASAKILCQRKVFVRGYGKGGATVRRVSDMVHLFPYDFLMFATHCGDANGYRWTYQYKDGEGIDRTLVVDIALGIANTDDEDLLEVMQFTRFHSLDGVNWSDSNAKESLYVGGAIRYYVDHKNELEPIKKENIGRVIGSAAMKMFDNNYIAIPYDLASGGTPIIVNNACVSWHELSGRFMFAGCRAYIGTLFPVTTSEAHDVVIKLLGKHFAKYLPHALWSSQRSVYGKDQRRPYVMTGVYVQRLRVMPHDAPRVILTKLERALAHWKSRLSSGGQFDRGTDVKKIESFVEYYRREVAEFRAQWFRKG